MGRIIETPIAVPLMTTEEQLEHDTKSQPTQEQIKERMAKLINTDDWDIDGSS